MQVPSKVVQNDKKHVWHPFTQQQLAGDPIEIVKANGVLLIDADGNEYIDANSSWWVNVHGHAHPHIAKAINEQFNTIDHIVFAGVTHPKAVELATRITSILPDSFQKVFFSDNGSTAVEIGMKMVFQYFYNKGVNKTRFLAMEGAYHGDTFGAMSVGQRGYFNKPFESFFFDVDYVEFPNESNEESILKRAKSLFETGEFAGFIVEPLVQGASGMRMYSADFLTKITRLAKQNGVLVIFDEVMTGFGRTGKMFALQHADVEPDIVTMSKGLTAGVMALGLTVCTDEIYNAFLSQDKMKALLHGHSFTANPIACAVACANLDIFEQPETWPNINRLVEWNNKFQNTLRNYNCVANIRQQGTILAFELDTGEGNTYFSTIRENAYNFFIENGVLLRPLGNVLFINPPYSISEIEYNKITSAVLAFLDQFSDK